MKMTSEPALEPFNRLVGTWTTEATHPAVPGVVVHGTSTFEWLEGGRFLIVRSRTDHPDFPDAISIVGFTDQDRVTDAGTAPPPGGVPASMHYFDSRGVFRVYDVTMDDTTLRISRPAPGFSQRFTGTLADGGDTITGLWQLCRDDVHWNDDLQITYRRRREG